MEFSKTYDASKVEGKWYYEWEKNNFFTPLIDRSKKPFTIVIPPPNVTGILHMGHGLNNTIQDILIRWHRMQGVPTLWMPGTDHAGIATQNVVEKKLHREGKTRHKLGKEKFIEEVWKWKEEHGTTIINQLKRLGASCDWSRERFTMDEGLSRAVREVFVSLYEKGLIYRGYYIVNWCPRCHTALSDEESAHKELDGKLYYLKYPIGDKVPERLSDDAVEGKDYVVVATTRPETMLGDTAIAVNPKDERYAGLKDKSVMLPLLNRKLKVICDDFVNMEFGTGVVKVTPAHDPNDFEMGKRHNLEEINILNPDGTVNENGGRYEGLDRFEARKMVIEDLKVKNMFIKEEPHKHSVGHCYRCNTVVEPYLSKQWFVRMKPLAERAAEVVRNGKIKLYPQRWTKVYLNWMDNIRDWCISRQIWWGHRIPVWYCDDCGKISVSREDIDKCLYCSSYKIKRDEDVLDTWFSSWLWPFSTLGWPDKTEDLEYFYPTDVLVTGPDILFFWVARMIMAGLEFMGDIPFHSVYLHGTVRDETGRKMSKSLGNSIDPIKIIEEVGADALRFIVISLTSQGQDVYLSERRFLVGRNFTNKIWNAARFSFNNMEGFSEGSFDVDFNSERFSAIDRWIVSKLDNLAENITADLEKFRFNDACNHLYSFIWNDFCDWYLELSKPYVYGKRGEEKRDGAIRTLFYVWGVLLRLLHPFMPFITEELWHRLKLFSKNSVMSDFLIVAEWPEKVGHSFGLEVESVSIMKDIVSGIREKRSACSVPASKKLDVVFVVEDNKVKEALHLVKEDLENIAKVESDIKSSWDKKPSWVPVNLEYAVKFMHVFLNLGSVIDIEAEIKKLKRERERLLEFKRSIEAKLKNEKFLNNAPSDVVAREKKKLADAEASIFKITEAIESFK